MSDDKQKLSGHGAAPTREQVEKAHEEEYAYLLRRYRIDQEDTLKYKGAIKSTLGKQHEVIDSLYEVKDEVMVEVTVAKNYNNDMKDDEVFRELKLLLHQGDVIDKHIKARRLQVTEIERDIQKKERIHHNLTMQTRNTTDRDMEDVARRTERKVVVMKNRLHYRTVKCNEVLTDNRRRREELEDLLKERMRFNAAFQKMINLLHHGKTIMMDLVEMTKVAYEHREEAQMRVNMVGKHGNTNRETKAVMMAELTKQLDHHAQLKDFVSSKGQQRHMGQLNRKMAAKKARQRKMQEELLENYRSILHNILGLSGSENIEKTVRIIFKNDMDNFTRFLQVTEQEHMNFSLKSEVKQCREDIDVNKDLGDSRVKNRDATLVSLRKEHELRQAELTAEYELMQGNRQHVDDLLIGVEALFDLTELDNTDLVASLGDNEIPNEHNVWQYLEIIERFTKDILTKIMYIERTHSADELPLMKRVIKNRRPDRPHATLEEIDPQHPCAICVETTELSNFVLDSVLPEVLEMPQLVRKLEADKKHPDFDKHLHSLMFCPLPRSKKIEVRSRNDPVV